MRVEPESTVTPENRDRTEQSNHFSLNLHQLYEPYEHDKLIFLVYFILKHSNVLIYFYCYFSYYNHCLSSIFFFSSSSSIFVLVCETLIY